MSIICDDINDLAITTDKESYRLSLNLDTHDHRIRIVDITSSMHKIGSYYLRLFKNHFTKHFSNNIQLLNINHIQIDEFRQSYGIYKVDIINSRIFITRVVYRDIDGFNLYIIAKNKIILLLNDIANVKYKKINNIDLLIIDDEKNHKIDIYKQFDKLDDCLQILYTIIKVPTDISITIYNNILVCRDYNNHNSPTFIDLNDIINIDWKFKIDTYMSIYKTSHKLRSLCTSYTKYFIHQINNVSGCVYKKIDELNTIIFKNYNPIIDDKFLDPDLTKRVIIPGYRPYINYSSNFIYYQYDLNTLYLLDYNLNLITKIELPNTFDSYTLAVISPYHELYDIILRSFQDALDLPKELVHLVYCYIFNI